MTPLTGRHGIATAVLAGLIACVSFGAVPAPNPREKLAKVHQVSALVVPSGKPAKKPAVRQDKNLVTFDLSLDVLQHQVFGSPRGDRDSGP
ncbi:hypothetical protein LPB72_06490 [Hydrogenophaga crassostreae]|uniref:Uncharacterized protein n=1 Tax=Hydrogenophaga crassostreae TaxID=1763535 RepID=A0A167IJ33_9BURK|nr:hypothetical protein LPB072_16225 [Hydrogenophaga crassostreae]OAD42915.1 hypothetical protein LPB72_06490 [Hydrogenophaga crassostreae]